VHKNGNYRGRKVGKWERRKNRQKKEQQKAVGVLQDIERKGDGISEVSISHSGADENSSLLRC